MPELDAERRDQLAEALRARVIDWNTLAGPGSNRGVSDYLTDALAPLIAGWLAEAEAGALREAADELPRYTEGTDRAGTETWRPHDRDVYSLAIEEAQAALRDRADRAGEG